MADAAIALILAVLRRIIEGDATHINLRLISSPFSQTTISSFNAAKSMAGGSSGEGDKKDAAAATAVTKKKPCGFISQIFRGIFRIQRRGDVQKRLEMISKEEVVISKRMKNRSLTRNRRQAVFFSILLELPLYYGKRAVNGHGLENEGTKSPSYVSLASAIYCFVFSVLEAHRHVFISKSYSKPGG